ncbi:hypothetical protein ABT063_14225 [Streptomyces sp. NPDC002838]|uniref:hypothetical protein n=1 Tax=Streptomyces sp. NPDC002838 TaxID=3154436 RepID=UPI003332F89B
MRFVSVRLWAALPDTPGPQRDAVPSLLLRIRSAEGDYDVLARGGPAVPGAPPSTDGPGACTDEHFAVDTDMCTEVRWPACADVLHARHPRRFADATRLLGDITATHPGCRLAAVPLTRGGWAVTERTSRTVVPLAHRVPPEQPLLASCLHAWLVAGHTLRNIEHIHVLRGL